MTKRRLILAILLWGFLIVYARLRWNSYLAEILLLSNKPDYGEGYTDIEKVPFLSNPGLIYAGTSFNHVIELRPHTWLTMSDLKITLSNIPDGALIIAIYCAEEKNAKRFRLKPEYYTADILEQCENKPEWLIIYENPPIGSEL